jgi:deazaflavin-dependent oxidoreductase (nitroreductase family)
MNFIIKLFMSLHVGLYRLTGGRVGGSMGNMQVLILTTTGRKTGKTHVNPVAYFERDGGYLIVASNGGKDNHPAWYFNLKAKPDITIQVKDKQLPVHAEVVSGEKRAAYWKYVVQTSPNFANYEKSTKREIPLVFLSQFK